MDIEKMRVRFWELKDKIDAAEAISQPLREKRDAHVHAARNMEDAMNAEIREIEAGLFDLKQELAFIARGLGGKLGNRPTFP